MSKSDAINYAKGLGLDLIEVSKQDGVAVAIVADYGKFKYDQGQKEKQKKKGQVTHLEKEIMLSPLTEKHDMDVQVGKMREFLAKGMSVQITIRKKKRQIQPHRDKWFEVINAVIASVSDLSDLTSAPSFSGRSITAKVSPKKSAVQNEHTEKPGA
jgi:translation initiation factor IF-3